MADNASYTYLNTSQCKYLILSPFESLIEIAAIQNTSDDTQVK